MKFFLIFLTSFILVFTNAWAADDTVIQDLQTDVTATKGKADKNASDTESLKGGIPAERDARIAADQELLNSINAIPEGPPGPQGPPGEPATITPPVITHDAPVQVYIPTATVNVKITDDVEVAYYAFSDIAEPLNNKWVIAGPGQSVFTDIIPLSIFPEEFRTYILMAADTEGSISKAQFTVEYVINECTDISSGSDLRGCVFTNFDWRGFDLSYVDLSFATLSFGYMQAIYLGNAKLIDTTLQDVNLFSSNLENADLTGATLTNVDLNSAGLENADLVGATLTNVDLSMSYLVNTDLTGATLTNVNLDNVSTGGTIWNDITWSNVTCPDGTNSDDDDGDGFTCLNNLY